MNALSEINALDVTTINEPYDLFFSVIGYELRARYVAEKYQPSAKINFAAAFPDQKEYSYQENYDWFSGHNFEIKVIEQDKISIIIEDLFKKASILNEQVKILIDISSMTRLWIAVILDTVRNIDIKQYMTVDFIYSMAEFTPASTSLAPNEHVGPILKSYAGWTSDPERPPNVIADLGYEENKALGAVEHIQANDVWTFIPSSSIKEYDLALMKANEILLDSIPLGRRIEYQVEKPLTCFIILETLAHRCSLTGSTVILPFGPKIFTLCALLVATLHPEISVWRVSAGRNEPPLQRIPFGEVIGLRIKYNKNS